MRDYVVIQNQLSFPLFSGLGGISNSVYERDQDQIFHAVTEVAKDGMKRACQKVVAEKQQIIISMDAGWFTRYV